MTSDAALGANYPFANQNLCLPSDSRKLFQSIHLNIGPISWFSIQFNSTATVLMNGKSIKNCRSLCFQFTTCGRRFTGIFPSSTTAPLATTSTVFFVEHHRSLPRLLQRNNESAGPIIMQISRKDEWNFTGHYANFWLIFRWMKTNSFFKSIKKKWMKIRLQLYQAAGTVIISTFKFSQQSALFEHDWHELATTARGSPVNH